MQEVRSKDISVAIQLGAIAVQWNVEDASWNPDVAHDIKNRMMEMLTEALELAYTYGMIPTNLDAGVEVEEEAEGEDG